MQDLLAMTCRAVVVSRARLPHSHSRASCTSSLAAANETVYLFLYLFRWFVCLVTLSRRHYLKLFAYEFKRIVYLT